MVLTNLPGIFFNTYGNTISSLPESWVPVSFNFKIKKHRAARDSKKTRVIIKRTGWTGTRRYRKPILSYFTDTPEEVERIKLRGDHHNSVDFILN